MPPVIYRTPPLTGGASLLRTAVVVEDGVYAWLTTTTRYSLSSKHAARWYTWFSTPPVFGWKKSVTIKTVRIAGGEGGGGGSS